MIDTQADPRFTTTSASGTDPHAPREPRRPSSLWRRWSGWSAVAIVGVVALAVSYSPELRWTIDLWMGDPNYSHGFLVIPVAMAIYWRRRDLTASGTNRPWPLAWPLLVIALAARAYFYEFGNVWAESITILPAVACLALTFGGWGQLRRAWPAIGFLAFMFPLPARINDFLAQPLQRLATQATTSLLGLTGLWVISDGNIIFVNDYPLEVAQACNGLSMLMSLGATVAAAVLLVPMSPWKRIVAGLSAIPIALGCNIVRISVTAWCYHLYGAKIGGSFAHDLAGWLMMPMALVLVGLEILVLSWMFVEEDIMVAPMLLGKAISNDRAKPAPRIDKPIDSPTVLPIGSTSMETTDPH